jgi:hypothetical protein
MQPIDLEKVIINYLLTVIFLGPRRILLAVLPGGGCEPVTAYLEVHVLHLSLVGKEKKIL